MATIEELEQLGGVLAEKEARALQGLVDYLRGSAEDLPDGSRLAVAFAVGAKKLEPWTTPRDAGLWGAHESLKLINELNRLQAESEEAS
jgi:hypothetical protein